MIGALLCMLIMLAIFTVEFLMDDTFKSGEDIEREFGVMPLTVIPEGKIEGLSEDNDDPKSRRKKRGKLGKSSMKSKSKSKSNKK
jgi:hypothetical protein